MAPGRDAVARDTLGVDTERGRLIARPRESRARILDGIDRREAIVGQPVFDGENTKALSERDPTRR
jgi:hypothetical protein